MAFWRRALSGLAVAFATLFGQQVASVMAENGSVAVLGTRSVWHIYTVLKPPMIQYDEGPKPLTSLYQWVDQETPAPPEGWNAIAFPDDNWLRTDARGEPHTPYAAELYLRGRFEVTDPAQAQGLKVSVDYHGGVIVFVNGREVGRGDLARNAKGPNALADTYPASAFVNEQGQLVGDGREAAARQRKLSVDIPADAIHKGVNVLAIEVIRAPYDKAVADYWAKRKEGRELGEKAIPYDLNWYTCEVQNVTLTGSGSGVLSNVARPKTLQAWNSDLLRYDTPGDMGDNCEPLQAVTIKGPRNGWSSGKVVLSLPRAIEGLKVTCSALKGPPGSATISASTMRARYAVAFEDANRADARLESLLEKPLDSFAVGGAGAAVVPVWLTVKIPATARPGKFSGQVSIAVNGEKTLDVPVNLEVSDFAVPDTQNNHTWMELMESPDSLAAEYNVPLWSDKHWELIAQSMRYMGEIGSRVVHIPLIAQTNSGNEQSLVRFIKRPDGSYDYDLSLVDKYLDYAEKYEGKPKIVAFIAWELYLATPAKEVKDRDPGSEGSWQAARWDLRGKGPTVTAIDPATKEISTINLPRFEDPASRPIWKPLFDELHRRMAGRGLERTMLLGMASDYCPNKEEMATLEDVSGNLPWIIHTHGGSHVDIGNKAKVAYTAYVWDNVFPRDPSKGRYYGWKRPELIADFQRFGALNDWPLASILEFPELQITGQQRGVGRVGADFWPVLKDKRGQRRGYVWDKYPQSKWHSCNLSSHLLDPGPDGPVATSRYEMMREGVQECEARIAMERVLTDNAIRTRLGPELENKAQKMLDDRVWEELKGFSGLQLTGRVYTTYTNYGNVFYYNAGGEAGGVWYTGSGWQDRAEKLYDLAGEFEKRIGRD